MSCLARMGRLLTADGDGCRLGVSNTLGHRTALTVLSSDAAAAAAATPAHRDRYVDLLRVSAILLVVTGHWLAVTITVHDGRVGGVNAGASALQLLTWARPLTWLFQVMPIFFLVGGYVNTASWSSHQRRGGDGTTWVRSRMFRLLRPTAIFVFVLAAARGLGSALGLDPDIVGGAVRVAALALWFLVVYIAVVALAPALITWQRRWGHSRVILLLVAGVAVVDLSRLVFAESAAASSAYLLGWLAVHQLGVAWRDGVLTRSPRTPWLLAGGGLLSLLVLTGPGPYAVSMFGAVGAGLQNIAPPTLALLALAAGQTGLVLLLHGPVERWLTRPRLWTAVVAVNAVVLTVYLWHMVSVVIGAHGRAGRRTERLRHRSDAARPPDAHQQVSPRRPLLSRRSRRCRLRRSVSAQMVRDVLRSRQPSAPSRSWQACSQRRHASAHTRQCSCREEWRSHSSPQERQTVAQACSTARVMLAS